MVRAYRRPRGVVSLLVVCMLSLGPFAQGVDAGLEIGTEMVMMDDVDPPASIVQPDAGELLSNIDGFFTENLGQKGEGAGRFYCQGSPLSVAFDDEWVAYDFRPMDCDQGAMFQVSYMNANSIMPKGIRALSHSNNFFIGNDPDKWVTGAENYKEIQYEGLYEGIDLIYRFNQGRLKYDFIIEPFVDPNQIIVEYRGILGLTLDGENGDLLIQTAVGPLRDTHPIAYQELHDGKRMVETSFYLIDTKHLSFHIGQYNPSHPLVIDPGLNFSTFIGGSGSEWKNYNFHVDEDGYTYITGCTDSWDFPTTSGAYDDTMVRREGYVFKLSNDGKELVFSTLIGGTEIDGFSDVAVDSFGNVYIAGSTDSTDYPTTSSAFDTSYNDGGFDGALAIFNPIGTKLLASTYFGGTGREWFQSIALDGDGNIVLSGQTESNDLPTVTGCYDSTANGGWDAFVVKMDTNASSLLNMTYLGGSGSEEYAEMTLGKDDSIFLEGQTQSNDYPTSSRALQQNLKGIHDFFVAKLDCNATSLEYSTYVGGSDSEYAWGDISIDTAGCAIISGYSTSSDFPITGDAYDSTFTGGYEGVIFKIDSTGTSLDYSTFIGGSLSERCNAVMPADDGSLVFAIKTASNDMDTSIDAFDGSYNGGFDWYVGRLNISTGLLEYGTYIGGSSEDSPQGIHVHGDEVTVYGMTQSTDFPTTQGAYDSTYNGGGDFAVIRVHMIPKNATRPSSVTNLTATLGDRMVNLSWDPPKDTGNITLRGYVIYSGVKKENMTCVKITDATRPECTVRPTVLAQSVYYAVTAFNLKGESNRSDVVEVVPIGSPLAPGLSAVAGCSSVQLEWTPPIDIGSHPITGYSLFRGTATSDPEPLVELGNTTSHLDEGLTNGVEYTYQVAALNAIGLGERSELVSVTPYSPPSPPQAVTLIPEDRLVKISWSPPRSDGGRPVLGYTVIRGTDGSEMEEIVTTGSYETSYIDPGLTNGLAYSYGVKAFNEIGPGPISTLVNATPVGLPGIPVGFQVSPDDGQVMLSWSIPESNGGTPIIRYEVFRGTTETTLGSIDITDADVTDHTDDGLMNGMILYYAVSAVNKVGNGPLTEVISATPLALPDAPGDLVAIAGNGMVTISWLRPMNNGGAEVTQYNIHRGTSEADLEPLRLVAKSRFIYDDSEVVVVTTYYYAVAAVTVAGEGPPSIIASATPYGPPGLPVFLEATPGNREVRLAWSAPEDDGASPIEGYVILRGTSATNLRELAQLGDVASYLDTSVTNDQTYYYAIAAINEAGPGDYTEPVPATPFKPTTAPGKVTTLVTDAKGAKVTLQWTAPQDDGGSPVTGYVILRGLSKDSLEQIAEVGPGVTTWSEEGLERGTTYYYSVAAKNDVGEGEPILAREVKVPKKKDEGPGFEALAVVAAMMLVIPMIRRRG